MLHLNSESTVETTTFSQTKLPSALSAGTIPDKKTFYRLWDQGLLGNKPRSWRTLSDFFKSDYRGAVFFRYALPLSPFRAGNVPFEKVTETFNSMIARGARPDAISISEALPREQIIFHGGLQRSQNYYDLDYSTKSDLLKDTPGSLETHRFASGLIAKKLVEAHLSPNSLEDLKELLDLFPNSVIDFSVFDRHVGMLPRRNTIFWEVRNY